MVSGRSVVRSLPALPSRINRRCAAVRTQACMAELSLLHTHAAGWKATGRSHGLQSLTLWDQSRVHPAGEAASLTACVCPSCCCCCYNLAACSRLCFGSHWVQMAACSHSLTTCSCTSARFASDHHGWPTLPCIGLPCYRHPSCLDPESAA